MILEPGSTEGTHQRFIVTVATFAEKMKAKADKRG
jgi:predicted thioesterase